MTKIFALLVVPLCAQTLGQDFLQKPDATASVKLPAVATSPSPDQHGTVNAEAASAVTQAAASQVAAQAAKLAQAAAVAARQSAPGVAQEVASATASQVAVSAAKLASQAAAAAAPVAPNAAGAAGAAASVAAQAAQLATQAATAATAAATLAVQNGTKVASMPSAIDSTQALLSNTLQAASIPGASPAMQWHPWHPFQLWSELSTLERLLTGISFAGMIKALCMAGNILVQVSPYPQVQRWELRGCTGESDPAPYVSIAFGGWQWCYYGFFAYFVTARSGFLILVHSNILGAILGSYYTVTYFRNCKHPEMLQNLQKYLAAVISLVLLQLCALCMLPVERALFMTGLVSSFCSFVGAISMLFVLPAVLKSQDSRAIPGPLVVANLVSAIVWCICGAMLADPMIAAPNLVCCISSMLCLYLKFLYPSAEDITRAVTAVTESTENKGTDSAPRTVRPRPWKFGLPTPAASDATESTPLAQTGGGDCGTGGTF